jgi:hypothetical protein
MALGFRSGMRMSLADLYTELKSWQTGIGAAFGFVALMLGALFNFHLNRRRDAALRRDESLAVATALYSEILLLREEAARLAKIIAAMRFRDDDRDVTEQFVADHMPRDSILYVELAAKLGILPPDYVLAITRFHRDYQNARDGLKLMIDKGRGYHFSVLTVLNPAKRAVLDIRPILRKIEAEAGIKIAAPDPDLGHTEDIIDMENEYFNAASGKNA